MYHLELAPSQQVVEIFYILLTIDLTKKHGHVPCLVYFS
nr:MAG TPA: hypothetical protein [Caudoviricetes sp.]